MKKVFLAFVFAILLVVSVYAASRGSGGSLDDDVNEIDADDNDTDSDDSLNEARGNMIEERGEIREERRQIRSKMMEDKLKTPRAMEIRRKLNDIKLERVETSGLRCFEEDDIEDRVRCRLNLSRVELRKEYKLEYLPEECRTIDNMTERQNCVRRYAQLQKCWKFIGDERMRCVDHELNITKIKEQKRECNLLDENEKQECRKRLKDNVYHRIKFKFYNLEDKAERFLDRGWVDNETVAVFIANLEIKKAEFNEAATKEEKRKVILEVRELWKEFLKSVNWPDKEVEEENETEG
nr:hypothetical protein [Candidatus Woesearchaeota archaeon]